ncbi:MAG: AAA family ATPase [Methylocella sp.]
MLENVENLPTKTTNISPETIANTRENSNKAPLEPDRWAGCNHVPKAARDLADEGFKVFPIAGGRKAPPVKGWRELASYDPAALEKIFADNPGYDNIGIATENLLVLDFDTKHGRGVKAILAELEDALGIRLPKTQASKTPSKGGHLMFALPDGGKVKSSAGRLINPKTGEPIKGLDVRGQCGYILAPGSRTIEWHENGAQTQWAGEYRWDRGRSPADMPMAMAPQALVDLAGRAGSDDRSRRGNEVARELDTPEASERAIKYLKDKAPKAEEGSRRDVILAIANRLMDFGCSPETAAELIADHWAESKCSPPVALEGEKGVLERVLGAAAARNEPIGCDYWAPCLPPWEVFDTVKIDDDWRRESELKRKGSRRKLKRINFADCSKAALEKGKNTLIENVIGRAQTSCWYGPPGCGKTNILLEAGCAVARGAPWAGRKTKQGLVVYVACEGTDIIIKRLAAIRKTISDEKIPFVLIQERLALYKRNEDRTLLMETICECEREYGEKCELVIIDTVAKAMVGGKENSADEMNEFAVMMADIVDAAGCHVAMIHHSGKDISKGGRGSNALLGSVDTEIEITKDRIRATKQRDFPEGNIGVFNLKTIELGSDAEGDMVTASVSITKPGSNSGHFRRGGHAASAVLSANERQALDHLKTASGNSPGGRVAREVWQSVIEANEGPAARNSGEQKNRARAIKSLVEKGLVLDIGGKGKAFQLVLDEEHVSAAEVFERAGG